MIIKLLNRIDFLSIFIFIEEDGMGRNIGFTLVEVMIVLMLISSLSVLAIPGLLRARVSANESSARATLKTIAVALENHASKGGGGYTTDFSDLTSGTPPYLNNDYIAGSPYRGYIYSCDSLQISGYSCSAEPQHCNQTGSMKYTITTGAVFSEEACEG
jgi:prepilin-type N-terminal cleavage/methylation domain-containing protein